jgi:hypothetical protein
VLLLEAQKQNVTFENQTLDNNTSVITCLCMLLPVELYRHRFLIALSEYDTSARHGGLKGKMFGVGICRDGGHEGHFVVQNVAL